MKIQNPDSNENREQDPINMTQNCSHSENCSNILPTNSISNLGMCHSLCQKKNYCNYNYTKIYNFVSKSHHIQIATQRRSAQKLELNK